MARLPRPASHLAGGSAEQNTQKPSPTQPKKINQEHTEQKHPDPKLGTRQKVEDNPQSSGKRQEKISSAAEKGKSAIHGGDSRFIYVPLDPPRKRTSQVCLQTSRTSYSSRRNRVARRRKRKLYRSRVVQTSNQIYPIRCCSRADFPERPQTVIALVSKGAPLGSTVLKYRRSQ